MQLSYAQNLEDYHLDLVLGDQPTGTYVDVGGGHPVADNVSFWFYLKGWSGLVVEPQQGLADAYAGVRPRDHGRRAWPAGRTARQRSTSSTSCTAVEHGARARPGAAQYGAGYNRPPAGASARYALR